MHIEQNTLTSDEFIFPSVLIALAISNVRREARGGYLAQFLLGVCRWPLRAPTPL